jgi:hypothetical protein
MSKAIISMMTEEGFETTQPNRHDKRRNRKLGGPAMPEPTPDRAVTEKDATVFDLPDMPDEQLIEHRHGTPLQTGRITGSSKPN